MTVYVFLMLLASFSVLSSLSTEAIKKLVVDKEKLSYNIIALITAMIIGCGGCGIYYQLNGLPFDINNIIYMILMGLASGLCSMIGYDKFKEALIQCGIIQK